MAILPRGCPPYSANAEGGAPSTIEAESRVKANSEVIRTRLLFGTNLRLAHGRLRRGFDHLMKHDIEQMEKFFAELGGLLEDEIKARLVVGV
jgi:hypothetical protein